jgi:hypothetical protein
MCLMSAQPATWLSADVDENCADASLPCCLLLHCCCDFLRRFVPSDYRILYNNVVCVAWLTYLSLLTHTKINILSFLHLTH